MQGGGEGGKDFLEYNCSKELQGQEHLASYMVSVGSQNFPLKEGYVLGMCFRTTRDLEQQARTGHAFTATFALTSSGGYQLLLNLLLSHHQLSTLGWQLSSSSVCLLYAMLKEQRSWSVSRSDITLPHGQSQQTDCVKASDSWFLSATTGSKLPKPFLPSWFSLLSALLQHSINPLFTSLQFMLLPIVTESLKVLLSTFQESSEWHMHY